MRATGTKDNCTEDTARKHLKSLIGERSQAKYIINAEGEEAYAVTVEVVMVYRIYLTRSIRNRWQATWGQQGRGHQEPTIAETQAAKGSSSQSAGGDGDGNLLKRRMDDLERQLAEMRPTNAAAAASAYNRESYFQDTLDRPVAIGFRGIRVDLGRTGGKSKTKSLQ